MLDEILDNLLQKSFPVGKEHFLVLDNDMMLDNIL